MCAVIAFFLAFVSAAPAAEQIDQSNVPEWGGGWTHVNPAGDGQASMWQTFTPTCSNLTAVEIDILTTNPGRGGDVLTVEIARDGAVLVSAERSVEDGFDGLLRFEFPQVVPVVPEQIYELRVHDTGTTRFGWKYASNTYERGSRYVFAQERPGADWFFKTYAGVEPAEAKYSGGNGTVGDPYRIATAGDLIALGETPEDYDRHFIMTADIDLDADAPNLLGRKTFDRAVVAPDVNDSEPWFQGTPFAGVFDGNDRTISNLRITGGEYLGLFGQLGSAATVSNLSLKAVKIRGIGWVGGLVGWNEGRIIASYVGGSISATGDCVGGLVGTNLGSISSSCSSGSVMGNGAVGGLVGWNQGNTLASWSSASVSGTTSAGGLVARNEYGSIVASYSRGSVSGNQAVGGLLCDNRGGSVSSSFWDIEASGQDSSAGGTGKATDEMKTERTFADAGWDFVGETVNGTQDIWWILEGQDYPRLCWEPYEDISPQPMDTNRPVTISKTVVTGETDGIDPGEQVVFRIRFETGVALTEVFVLDTLPEKVVFCSAQYLGVSGYYDPVVHTFLWRFPQLAAGEQRQVDITVLLHNNIPAGTTITNMARIWSDQTEPIACTLAMTVGEETDN